MSAPTSSAQRKALFLPYDVLSSVTRQLELAQELRSRGYDVLFAGEGPFLDLVAEAGFPIEPLPNLRAERLLAHLRRLRESLSGFGRVAAGIWRELDLAHYLDAELVLLRRFRPSLVLSEERPTAQISAHIEGIPHVSLRNAYRTAYSSLPMLDLSGSFLRRLHPDPVVVQNAIIRWLGAPFFWRLRSIARSRGLPQPLRYEEYVEGDDLSLLCDVPEFSPTRVLPARYAVIGPLFWDPLWPDPDWLDELPADRSTVYVSLGSSGTPALFRALADSLRTEGATLAIATGRQIAAEELPAGDGVWTAELVRATRVLERVGLCVCHGGNGTVYQALSRGVPLICVPTHLEQRFNARRITELGLGLDLELRQLLADPSVLARAVRTIRADSGYRERAAAWQRRIAELRAPAAAAEALEQLLAARR